MRSKKPSAHTPRERGRPRKVIGTPVDLPGNRPGRRTTFKAPLERVVPALLGSAAPRGATGKALPFTQLLKERAPLVYAFIEAELGKRPGDPDRRLAGIIGEWKRTSGGGRANASALTAFVVERAFGDAWGVWGVKRLDQEGFLRRYVYGQAGALKTYRALLCDPQPWPRFHVGHDLDHFLGARGDAARAYNVTTRTPIMVTVVSILTEAEHKKLYRSKR